MNRNILKFSGFSLASVFPNNKRFAVETNNMGVHLPGSTSLELR
jgi:hypothetical protein